MTFRRSILALAVPVLSIAVIGCQPPVEEKGTGPAPSASDVPVTAPPTTEPKPSDVMPSEPTAPATTTEPTVAPAPTEPTVTPPLEEPKVPASTEPKN